jgi:hypothetical protein
MFQFMKRPRDPDRTPCCIEGCENYVHLKDHCRPHYEQLFPRRPKVNEIKIKEKYALMYLKNKKQEVVGRVRIDLEDVKRVRRHKWCMTVTGYAYNTAAGYLHRFIMNHEEPQYDHKNRNKLDCRKKNLRPCTEGDNHRNRTGYGAVPAKGVWFTDASKTRYRVSAPRDNGRNVYVGVFDDLIEAAEAYNRVASKCKTKIIVLNDIEKLRSISVCMHRLR